MLTKLVRISCFIVLLSTVLISVTAAAFSHVDEVESAVKSAMKKFNVPGIAVAIVKDGQIVMAEGYGVIEHGKSVKVTPDTLFGIASNTKAMTAAILASLVDEGKLDWQTPVVDILPEFQLYDANVTREITVQDLLSHNSGLGLGAGDLLIWPGTTYSKQQILSRLKHVKPASSFRSKYAYNNLMFVTAGEVIARVTGKSWATVIKERIFTPLNMTNTRAKYSLIDKSKARIARAHVPLDNKLHVVGGDFLEQFSSAGSVASSVNDMSKWLIARLNHGAIAGSEQRLFSETQSRKMWQPHTVIPVSKSQEEREKTFFNSYGLGWVINDYHGYKLAQHSGGILGMVSKVVLVPSENLGMVILTNQQSGAAFNVIYREILETFLQLEDTDWLTYYAERGNKWAAKEKQRVEKVFAERHANSSPSLKLSDYAQTYQDKWYGDVVITEKEGKLHLAMSKTPSLVGTLEHFQHNTFVIRWHDRTIEADAFINFDLSAQGKIKSASIEAVSYKTDFSFDFHDLHLVPQK